MLTATSSDGDGREIQDSFVVSVIVVEPFAFLLTVSTVFSSSPFESFDVVVLSTVPSDLFVTVVVVTFPLVSFISVVVVVSPTLGLSGCISSVTFEISTPLESSFTVTIVILPFVFSEWVIIVVSLPILMPLVSKNSSTFVVVVVVTFPLVSISIVSVTLLFNNPYESFISIIFSIVLPFESTFSVIVVVVLSEGLTITVSIVFWISFPLESYSVVIITAFPSRSFLKTCSILPVVFPEASVVSVVCSWLIEPSTFSSTASSLVKLNILSSASITVVLELPSELITTISVPVLSPSAFLVIVVFVELPLESVINTISTVVLSLFVIVVITFVSPIFGSSRVVVVSELLTGAPAALTVFDLFETISLPFSSFVVRIVLVVVLFVSSRVVVSIINEIILPFESVDVTVLVIEPSSSFTIDSTTVPINSFSEL